ncbi:podocalyxin-like protein 2 isoform X1 [Megalobrama amblycephala]|uniref:podocalyxin-like protein 2 isoform X1 n=1 Tax=Megalobrama amblycephala TaxID=75352 RepID=UPI0020143B56|nr:podocalyxin-like protein 2 isoform X1 [Megalobrama amblycephala]XP_048038339.1 podocalyxin-like protein 2 isoform X1 [Megalobrama amblycephala]
MSVVSFQCLMFGSVFLVLVCAEVLSAGPSLLPNPLRSHGPVLDVPIGFEEHDVSRGHKPGFMESSQESSGFFSEDSEDGKNAQANNKDSGADPSAVNERCLMPKKVGPCRATYPRWHFNPATKKCENFIFGGCKQNLNNFLSLEECTKACQTVSDYSPSSPEPPSSPLSLSQKPSETNSSSLFFIPTAEPVDPEQWESDSESSGFPLHPSPGPSRAGAEDHAQSTATATPTALGLARQNQQEATAGPDKRLASQDPFDDEKGRAVTQVPTAPEIGTLPSREPLQPDEPHQDDSEEEEDEEEMVVFPTEPDEEENDNWRYLTPLTTGPSSSPASDLPPVVFTETSWQGAPLTTTEDEEGAELRHGGTEYLAETELHDSELSQEAEQVICVDWSNLAGKGYVILNMTDNFDCDEFRMESGDRLLEMLENTFSRKMNIPQGSWLIFLSKPTQQDHQLLMALASEQEIIAPKEVLSMLGEIRRGLYEIGIQNYSTVNTCHSRPSQTRSDYGKLFVVLVIIGSVCVLIIASGIIYICWQRRLPKLKNMSRGEELHFVENGCHDNPTLDVTSDSQSEMQEKKHSANGVTVGGDGGSGWQVLVNKPGKDEEDNQEEDTHL